MIEGKNEQEVSEAARAMGSIKTERKSQASRRTLAQAREALEADPEAMARKADAVSKAQKARWDAYRANKAAEKQAVS